MRRCAALCGVGSKTMRCAFVSRSVLYALVIVAATFMQSCFGADFNSRRWKRQSCSSGEFQCESGQCISHIDICNGIINCDDRSDETEKTCQSTMCPVHAFRCSYGACVNGNAKCNGKKECVDGSDENECTSTRIRGNNICKIQNFICDSGTCIDTLLICDGTKDCDDGSDETEEICGRSICPTFAFRCNYGACIDGNGVCNGVKQCADGSDESEMQCRTDITHIPTLPPLIPTTTISTPSGCKLPPQPENGKYKMGSCNPPACHPVPETIVQSAVLNYTCDPGFSLLGSQILLCDRKWSSPFPICSRVSCPPLVDTSRVIRCKLNDRKVECDKPVAPGTEAEVFCSGFYTNANDLINFETVCEPNGKWTKNVTSCYPKCGEEKSAGTPLVFGGMVTEYGDFPWHAGVYRLIDEDYEQVCGGSIVSERAIVTAAHCFWNVGLEKEFDQQLFKVAVGKFYRDWNNDTNSYIQRPEIDEIILHERFIGSLRVWQDDIALITLKVKIKMTPTVRPICLDFEKKYDDLILHGKRGIVVGWGVTDTMKPSERLITATLPYVGFQDCVREVPQTFLSYLTNDKFCAGYLNGTSVCSGDSGGGYATKMRDGKWYLLGIVSIGVSGTSACNNYEYTTYTNVSYHYNFVKGNYV